MKFDVKLNAQNPTAVVNLPWADAGGAARVFISNPTGSIIALRKGANDIPTSSTADELVPGGGRLVVPVDGCAFALALLIPAAATGGGAQLSNLVTTATVEFLTADEPPPAFGATSYQTLSLSDLVSDQSFSSPGAFGPFDLGAWGGALVTVIPSSGSGQGVVFVNASADSITWRALGIFAFWPNVPAMIAVPRTLRYLQVGVNATAIPGEPAIGGTISVRATISEVQSLTYNVGAQAITKTFNLAASGSQQYQFVTVGLPAVSLAAIATAGTGAGAATTFLVEASADLVNWRQVTFRTQQMSQGVTLYRALGNLDLFIRVSVFEVSGSNALVGSLYASIPPQADLGYILNTIQQSLGDNRAPTNTNQDIYHELDSIRQSESAISTYTSHLPNIEIYENAIGNNTAHLAAMDTNLAGVLSGTNHLNNIDAWTQGILSNTNHQNNIDANTANTVSLLGASGTLHGDLATLHTDLGASGVLNNDLVAINSNLSTGFGTSGTLHADLASLLGYFGAAVGANIQSTAVVTGGTWATTGIALGAGSRVYGIAAAGFYNTPGPANNYIGVGLGQAGGGVTIIYHAGAAVVPTTTGIQGPFISYASPRASGIVVPAFPNNSILVTMAVPGTHFVTVIAGP